MSPLLRRPNAVPSLFSQGGDHDDDALKSGHVSGLIAGRLESFAVAVGLSGEDTIVGRTSRALVGSSVAIFVFGLPLMKATRLVVAMSLAN